MLVLVVRGACRAKENRVTLQVYLPLLELLRRLNSRGKELPLGSPTVIPLPLDILLPPESSQLKMGVLRIPDWTAAEHNNSNMFPAIASPMGSIDSDRAVAGTVLKESG